MVARQAGTYQRVDVLFADDPGAHRWVSSSALSRLFQPRQRGGGERCGHVPQRWSGGGEGQIATPRRRSLALSSSSSSSSRGRLDVAEQILGGHTAVLPSGRPVDVPGVDAKGTVV